MSEKRITLVTGASQNIGLEICRQLGQKGDTVLLTARNTEKGEAAAKTLADEGLDVHFRLLDVTNDASVQTLAARVETEFGRLDALVNNAALFAEFEGTISTADLKTAHSLFETNVFGVWRTMQAFLPLLKKSAHPRLVNVSSGVGSYGDPQFGLPLPGGTMAIYAVTKAAVNALTAKFAAEPATSGVLVNAICPGFVATAPGMAEMGARPIPDGAASIVWGVTLPDDGPTGGFFRDGQPIAW